LYEFVHTTIQLGGCRRFHCLALRSYFSMRGPRREMPIAAYAFSSSFCTPAALLNLSPVPPSSYHPNCPLRMARAISICSPKCRGASAVALPLPWINRKPYN
jgi:hypothetical protein